MRVAVAILGLLFAGIGSNLLPHDHGPDEAGHQCAFCQIASVSGGTPTMVPATGLTTLQATGERVLPEDPFEPEPPAPVAGRLRDPPQT